MEGKNEHNKVEIVTFILGLAVLLALVGYLIYQIYQKKSRPPELQISTTYEPAMENYGFKLEVENTGEETASEVNIMLKLYQEGEAVEDGSVIINYVPVRSKETAWIVFHTQRKAGDSLVVSSLSYVKP